MRQMVSNSPEAPRIGGLARKGGQVEYGIRGMKDQDRDSDISHTLIYNIWTWIWI